MRITGGEFRGRTLKVPAGEKVRPTSDRVRQALFNILASRIAGAVVLDLFAGSGALGLEAVSRGAARAVLVEKARRTLDRIRENVIAFGVEDSVRLHLLDVLKNRERLRDLGGPFDVVFVDPPYRVSQDVSPRSPLGLLLETLFDGVVALNGIVTLEHDRRSTVAAEWNTFRLHDQRTWGDATVSFFVLRQS